MKTSAVRAMVVMGLLAGSQCAGRGTPGDILAEAEGLRLQFQKDAGRAALGKYREAIEAWRASDPSQAARAAQGLGLAFHQLGLLAESLNAYSEALAFAERSHDRVLEAGARADLGYARAWVADRAEAFDEAERLCEVAWATARQLRAAREEAKALVCLGEVMEYRGYGLEKALDVQRQVEALWTRIGHQRGVAQARLSQGWLYSDLRRFEDAQSAFESARRLWEEAGDRRGLAITLVAAARLLERRGEYQEALKAYDRACTGLEPMGDAVWEGSCLAGQAQIYQRLADGPRALEHFRNALEHAEATGQSSFAWDMLTQIGETQLAEGDDSAALATFERAYRLAERVANPRWQAWTLKYIGTAHLSGRAARQAEEAFQRALDMLPALGERWLEAQVLSGLGEASELVGQHDRAYRYFRDALAVSRRADDRILVARSLLALGTLEARQGRLGSARTSLGSALSDYEGLFGAGHPLVARARLALADVDFGSGQSAAALAAAIDAERTSLEHQTLTVKYLPERQALAFSAKRPRGLDLAISAVTPGTQYASSRVYDLVIRSRGVILDELAARSRLAGPSDPKVTDLEAHTNRARQRLANLLVQSLEGGVPQDQLDHARQEKEEAERELASQSVEARQSMAGAPAGLDRVRASMPEGSALVSFVQYARHVRSTGSTAQPSPVPSFAAFVMRAETPGIALVRLGTVGEIEQLINAWRGEAARPSQLRAGPLPDAERSYREAGERLRRTVWDPLRGTLRGATRVYVVPDGALGLVAFDGLPVGQTAFILEQSAPIHYLTAERDLVSTRSETPARESGMLALGGPAFDDPPLSPAAPTDQSDAVPEPADLRGGRTSCGSVSVLRFEPLAGTLEEAREVSRFWPAALGAARTLVGREASEQVFKQRAHDYRVLHLATHGFFLDGSCLPESGSASTRGVGGLSTTKPVENPLRLSGLALAGANRRELAGPDEDDGILTAEEVAALDLQGVEWAVLSACDTGIGEIKAGEGVFGLRRAFQVAGARTVVMSLWSVDDQATRAWMRALYEGRFQKKLSTADAVHQASLSVLRDRRARGQSTHPFYWAAFVAAGDWR